jgi:hypothetical protein
VELATLLDKLASPDKRRATLDVEVVGLCLHLQALEIERGRNGHELEDVTSIETDRGERLIVSEHELRLLRPGRREKALPHDALGDQQIVVGAPLVLLDSAGVVTAILGDVVTVVTR